MNTTPNPQEEDVAANSIDENDHRPKPRTIYVNTRPYEVVSNNVTFEEFVALAYPDPRRGTDLAFTIAYSRGHRRSRRWVPSSGRLRRDQEREHRKRSRAEAAKHRNRVSAGVVKLQNTPDVGGGVPRAAVVIHQRRTCPSLSSLFSTNVIGE